MSFQARSPHNSPNLCRFGKDLLAFNSHDTFIDCKVHIIFIPENVMCLPTDNTPDSFVLWVIPIPSNNHKHSTKKYCSTHIFVKVYYTAITLSTMLQQSGSCRVPAWSTNDCSITPSTAKCTLFNKNEIDPHQYPSLCTVCFQLELTHIWTKINSLI